MAAKFVPAEELPDFLESLGRGRKTFGTRVVDDHLRLAEMTTASAQLAPHRALDPIKSLFFLPRQDVGGYFGDSKEGDVEPRAVLGACACDLASLRILDYVFLEGDFLDPFYKALRDKTLIVSHDCTEPAEECFCTFVGGKPYAEKGFDVNLSPVDGGYIAEAGSDEGKRLLEQSNLSDATEAQMAERNSRREVVTEAVRRSSAAAGLEDGGDLRERIREGRDDPLWARLAESCVECAACNFVCPTCHCFVLQDVQEKEGFKRFRNWDACLYAAFAKEASGANPRARRAARLFGRVEKKFDFLKQNTGDWGCVGCGRCIKACAGKIDIRETLTELGNAQSVPAG